MDTVLVEKVKSRLQNSPLVYFSWVNLPFSLQETSQRCYGKDGSSRSEII